MANRIQLRRDHSANWTRINPILSDGEPGLEIDTNKIKYGDGTTAWRDLAYPTGSGSGATDRLVNGSYSVILGADGELTLPTGGHLGATKGGTMLDAGNGYSTSLTSFYPDGLYSSCVTANFDGNLYITTYNDGGPNPAKTWQFGLDGSTSLPLGGTVKETQFVSGGGIGGADLQGTLALTPNGAYNPWNNLTIYNTGFNAETQHLHLTSGDLNRTEIVLGDDNKFVKVNLDGSVCVQSSRYYLYNLAGTSGGSSTVISYANLNSIVSVGDYIIDAHGNAYQITGVTGTDPNWTIATNWASLTPLLASPYSFYKPNSTGGLWQFGADGSLTAPGPIYGGSNTIGLVTPAPLNLNNTGPVGQVKTQLNLINTAGNTGTGSAIDYFTYVDQGNGLPGARLSAVDDDNYSANFNIALKGRGNAGNNGLTTVWQFGSNGVFYLPNNSYIQPNGTSVNWGVQGNFNLLTDDTNSDTTKTFTFGADGTLTLPTNGVITSTPGYVGSGVPIENISRGTSTQLQVTGHGLSEGDKVAVNTITSTTQLNNNLYYVHVVDANNITLFTDPALTASVDSTAYTAYSYNGARTVVNADVTYSTDTPFYTYSNPLYSGNSNSGGTNNIDFTGYPDLINVKNGWTYTSNHGETGTVTADAYTYFGIIRINVSGPHSVTGGGSYTFTGVVATPVGGSMLFDGTTSVLQVKNDAVFAPTATTPWTLEFFAKYTTTLSQGATLFSIGAAANPMFALRVGGSNIMEIVLNGSVYSSGTYANAAYQPFGPNDWRHVAIVNNGSGTLAVFYSGSSLALEPPVSFTYDSLKTFAIGGSSADGTFGTGGSESIFAFPGLIRDFRFVVGTAVYDPTQSTLTVPTAPLDTTPTVTELYIIATDSSTFAIDTTTTEAHTGGGQVLKEFASADLVLEVGAVSQEDPGHVILKSADNQLKWGGASGVLTFPDGSIQTSAYSGKMAVLPPLTAWGTTIAIDTISFVFDGTTGVPGLNGGYGLGAGAYNTLIWTSTVYQAATTPTNYTVGANSPTQYFNYDGATAVTNSTPLQPGDYAEVKIQDIGTNKLYRVTFMGAYNPADNTNPTHYGSIAVERLV